MVERAERAKPPSSLVEIKSLLILSHKLSLHRYSISVSFSFFFGPKFRGFTTALHFASFGPWYVRFTSASLYASILDPCIEDLLQRHFLLLFGP